MADRGQAEVYSFWHLLLPMIVALALLILLDMQGAV